MMKFLKENIPFAFLLLFCVGLLAVTIKMTVFRFNNFDFGKFDLGNMTQMVWNTQHGRFMYLTDYFGTNLPRWAMSHVDPILVLFVPLFALVPHPLTLVISQLVLVIFSAVLIYKIANLQFISPVGSLLLSLAYLFYPALGFLLAWTGFHGVTVAIPFFLGAFYVFEYMFKQDSFTKPFLVLFWALVIITMSGKEEASLFVLVFGLFVVFVRKVKHLGYYLIAVSIFWFVATFFVIIPAYSHYRVLGYNKFASSLGINSELANDVISPNFFLSRYSEFGNTYFEVAVNMATHPRQMARVLFGGDKLDNLRMTFEPLLYMPVLGPHLLVMALPELLINYATTASGIGTSEIYNHRISLIIPVLFISTIYGIAFVTKKKRYLVVGLSALVLASNIYTTFKYENPIYLWLSQAISKRISLKVFAKDISIEDNLDALELGQRLRFSPLETNDRDCAQKVVQSIPNDVTVSGPDHLGAHLAKRETYAIFPALFDSAQYVITDVFAEKVARILGVNKSIIRDATARVMKDENYKLVGACSNLFVFERVGLHNKPKLLPIQEKFEYPERVTFEIFQSLTLVDYKLPSVLKRGENTPVDFVYTRRGDNSLDGYVLFLTFINNETRDAYQVANLPSFAINEPTSWTKDNYYIENVEVVIPQHMASGSYRVFIGMDNRVRTRSIYIGDVTID